MNGPRTAPPVYQLRPLLWRLPLVLLLAIGLLSLRHLDGLLRSDYRNQASVQAVQAEALLRSFMQHRADLLHTFRLLATDPDLPALVRPRFGAFASELTKSDLAPDLQFILVIDSAGVVRSVYPGNSAILTALEGRPLPLLPDRRSQWPANPCASLRR